MAVASRIFGIAFASTCSSLVAGNLRSGTTVSPVEKVINLLKQLQAETEAQGKKEAEQYDKFACFCKEQADEKLYQIEKSEKKIGKLNGQIKKLDGELNELNQEIKKKDNEIAELTQKIDDAAAARAKEHDAYKVEDADISGAIASMQAAIKALKDSKSSMDGAKLDLVQVKSAAAHALKVVAASKGSAPTTSQLTKLVALSQIGGKQQPPSYEYRSNDIIQTLEDLLDIFLKNKKDADNEEFEARAAWEKKDLNLKNVRKFSEKDKAELEAVAEQKSEEKAAAEGDKEEETNDKNADGEFMKVLTEECEAKAAAWDQRTQCRADELKAMAGAMEALSEKVSPSWGANSKLAGLQLGAVPKRSVSLLQVGRSQASTRSVVQKVAKLLEVDGKRIGSNSLAQLAVRASASEDHFVKVRGLIRDLVTRLEEDAKAEAEQKSFCDKAMSENTENRDNANAEIESLTAEKSRDESEKKKLTEEVADLSQAIAGLNKALNDATELRNNEHAENDETVATATEGKAGTELALKLLQEFYAGAAGALVQTKYVPPNSDREGKTFADRAPEVFDNDGYKGKQTGSKGIIGLLEVILSDFERTIATTNENEATAQEEFEAFEADTKADVEDKQKSTGNKEDRITELKDEITDGKDQLKEQNALLKTAEATLTELKTQCVDGEETYAERVAKREKEIASLKDALQILEEWQGF